MILYKNNIPSKDAFHFVIAKKEMEEHPTFLILENILTQSLIKDI